MVKNGRLIGDLIKIDKIDLILMTISLVFVISTSILVYLFVTLIKPKIIGEAVISLIILSIFSGVLFFFSYYQILRNLFFKIRTIIGEKITSWKKLDKEFKKLGGIIGYHPSDVKHIAIIYPSESKKRYPLLKKDGISVLMEHYKDKKINFRLYFCYLADDFLKIVKSKNVTGVHVFGHGRIDSILFEDGVVQYRELKDTIPKEFVAQWHCNHGDGKSLGEYIGREYFSPCGRRGSYRNKRDVDKLIRDELDWETNKNFCENMSITVNNLTNEEREHHKLLLTLGQQRLHRLADSIPNLKSRFLTLISVSLVLLTIISYSYVIISETSNFKIYLWIPIISTILSIIMFSIGFFKPSHSTLIISLTNKEFEKYKVCSEGELYKIFIDNLKEGLEETKEEIDRLTPYFNLGFGLFILSAIILIMIHFIDIVSRF